MPTKNRNQQQDPPTLQNSQDIQISDPLLQINSNSIPFGISNHSNLSPFPPEANFGQSNNNNYWRNSAVSYGGESFYGGDGGRDTPASLGGNLKGGINGGRSLSGVQLVDADDAVGRYRTNSFANALDQELYSSYRDDVNDPEFGSLPQIPYNRYRDSIASSSNDNSPNHSNLNLSKSAKNQRAPSYSSHEKDLAMKYPPYSPQTNEPYSHLLWTDDNKEPDDWLHNPSGPDGKGSTFFYNAKKYGPRRPAWNPWSSRGWLNTASLFLLVCGFLALFLAWPVIVYTVHPPDDATLGAYGPGYTNSTGQVGVVAGWHGIVDYDTPKDVYSRKGFDGSDYTLVFSDEFNQDGRTFWPGDDPFWEAVDLHYWATEDLEWYDPDQIVTKDGSLQITISEQPLHDLNFVSGMLQSWNKFCFTGGYIEVNVSFPGSWDHLGLWPAAWTIGNLVRPGYGATADGMWPYSYSACDTGTFPGQVSKNGTPSTAKTDGDPGWGGSISFLDGQRASACTCSGQDHPGPDVSVGRGGPEIDIFEAQGYYFGNASTGSVSQSIQVAPMDGFYVWANTSGVDVEYYNTEITRQNAFTGSVYQESCSVITATDNTTYNGKSFKTFGFEYTPGSDGTITWQVGGVASWTLNAAAIGPNVSVDISQRDISNEPMSIVLNLALSKAFQDEIDWAYYVFPYTYYIDYVRIYQKGDARLGCDPADYPTSDYIANHPNAYLNPNMTTWDDTGYDWPVNGLYEGGC